VIDAKSKETFEKNEIFNSNMGQEFFNCSGHLDHQIYRQGICKTSYDLS
jgi:hypothetical protein